MGRLGAATFFRKTHAHAAAVLVGAILGKIALSFQPFDGHGDRGRRDVQFLGDVGDGGVALALADTFEHVHLAEREAVVAQMAQHDLLHLEHGAVGGGEQLIERSQIGVHRAPPNHLIRLNNHNAGNWKCQAILPEDSMGVNILTLANKNAPRGGVCL